MPVNAWNVNSFIFKELFGL